LEAKRDVQFSPRAQQDIEDIWDFTLETWGDAKAQTYIRAIQAGAERLRHNPFSGPACDHIRRGYRKLPVGSHMMFYRVENAHIIVVRILHQRMDPQRRL
jgi:toxin ParE1/3/4